MRLFIAVEIPQNVQSTLDKLIKHLKYQIKVNSLRWVSVHNIHITLKFLGETPNFKVEGLASLITQQAASFAPFDIRLSGLGAFPSTQKPRVVWIGIEAPPVLIDLQKGIERGGVELGFPSEERPFTPHLTLARVAQDAAQEEIRQIGMALSATPAAPESPVVFHVDAIHLIRSDLRPTGAVYTRIASATLGSAGQTTIATNKPVSG